MLDSFISSLSMPIQIIAFLLILVIGGVFLVKCCDIFLDCASLVARKFKIPKVIIGLTIVAIGTSIPELSVSISDTVSSAIEGSYSNIGFSNVIGSNISNLLLVLSFGCLFSPIIIKKDHKKDYGIMAFITALLGVFVLLFGENTAILRWEAIVLTSLIIFYVTYLILNSKNKVLEQKDDNENNIKILKPIILIVLCIVGIAIGGELVVYGAKGIALNISNALKIEQTISESLVGLTIVAVGTSLPELVTTVMASKKGENELALGNVIGSNIFNIIFVVGISGIIAPFTISSYMIIDLLILIGITMFVMIFVLKGKLDRKHSLLFLSLYILYVAYLIIRVLVG